MKPIIENKKKLTIWIVGVAAACILLFAVFQNIDFILNIFSNIFSIISPLILGLIFALILNVPMRFFESHLWQKSQNKILIKLRSPIAFVISLIIIFGVITGIFFLVIPELYNSVKIIFQGASDIINRLSQSEKIEFAGIPVGEYIEKANWDEIIKKGEEWLKNQSGSLVNNAFTFVVSFIGGIFDFLISFVFSIYIIFSKRALKTQAKRFINAWFPKEFSEWFIHACIVAGKNFRNFISGQSLEAVILGTLCMIGMLILKIPYAPMVGILVGITALVPVVGGFIGAGVGAFMILTVNPLKAVIFVIFLIILQQLENNLIYPKVMGSKVNLPGMWILASVTVGGGIGGVFGMLLAVPVASTAYILIKEATLKREKLKLEEQSEIALEEMKKEAEETKKDAKETEKEEITVSKDENNN